MRLRSFYGFLFLKISTMFESILKLLSYPISLPLVAKIFLTNLTLVNNETDWEMTWSGLASLPPSRDLSSLSEKGIAWNLHHSLRKREQSSIIMWTWTVDWTQMLRTSGFFIFLIRRTGSIVAVVTNGSCISVQDAATALWLIDMMALLWHNNLKQRLPWFRWASADLLLTGAYMLSNLLLCGLWLVSRPLLIIWFAAPLTQSWVPLMFQLLIIISWLTQLYSQMMVEKRLRRPSGIALRELLVTVLSIQKLRAVHRTRHHSIFLHPVKMGMSWRLPIGLQEQQLINRRTVASSLASVASLSVWPFLSNILISRLVVSQSHLMLNLPSINRKALGSFEYPSAVFWYSSGYSCTDRLPAYQDKLEMGRRSTWLVLREMGFRDSWRETVINYSRWPIWYSIRTENSYILG